MCDFHSIAVRRDGAVAHIPGNSHSGAVKAAGWTENDSVSEMRGVPRFNEAEWNGDGKFPGVDSITRGCSSLTEKQRSVIEGHYTALASLLSNPEEHAERMLFGSGIFAGDEYADIRWRVLIHPSCPKRVADKLVKLPLHANGERIKSFDPRITELSGNLAVEDGYEISAPALTKVGGDLYVDGSAKLDALTEVGGDLYVDGSAKLDAPALTKVGGDLKVDGSAKLDAPKLKRSKQ
jgi:hypothetical protein